MEPLCSGEKISVSTVPACRAVRLQLADTFLRRPTQGVGWQTRQRHQQPQYSQKTCGCLAESPSPVNRTRRLAFSLLPRLECLTKREQNPWLKASGPVDRRLR